MGLRDDFLQGKLPFDRTLQSHSFRWFLLLLFVLFAILSYESENSGYPKGGPRITNLVYFDITEDGKGIGRFVIGVFGEAYPNTTLNFVTLASGSKGFGYKNSRIHRVVKGFVIQGGDFTKGDGSGGRAIFDSGFFPNENLKISHRAAGIISMANAGPERNSSQFFIIFKPATWLDQYHTAFGKVVSGWDVLQRINRTPTGKNGIEDRPTREIMISNCGVLPAPPYGKYL